MRSATLRSIAGRLAIVGASGSSRTASAGGSAMQSSAICGRWQGFKSAASGLRSRMRTASLNAFSFCVRSSVIDAMSCPIAISGTIRAPCDAGAAAMLYAVWLTSSGVLPACGDVHNTALRVVVAVVPGSKPVMLLIVVVAVVVLVVIGVGVGVGSGAGAGGELTVGPTSVSALAP